MQLNAYDDEISINVYSSSLFVDSVKSIVRLSVFATLMLLHITDAIGSIHTIYTVTPLIMSHILSTYTKSDVSFRYS